MQVDESLVAGFRDIFDPFAASKVRVRSGTGRGKQVAVLDADSWEADVTAIDVPGPTTSLEAINGAGEPIPGMSKSFTMPSVKSATRTVRTRESVQFGNPEVSNPVSASPAISDSSTIRELTTALVRTVALSQQLAARQLQHAEMVSALASQERLTLLDRLFNSFSAHSESEVRAGILETVIECAAPPSENDPNAAAKDRFLDLVSQVIERFPVKSAGPSTPKEPCPVPPPVVEGA